MHVFLAVVNASKVPMAFAGFLWHVKSIKFALKKHRAQVNMIIAAKDKINGS